MGEKSYQLIMQRGPKPGQVYQLLSRTTTVGRDPMVDVVIADPEVSRQHARLVRTGAGYQIQDLGSTNGTFVNGQRLGGEPRLLQAGQEILLGSSVTLLYMDAPEGGSPLPPIPPASTMEATPDAPGDDEPAPADEEHDPWADAFAPEPVSDVPEPSVTPAAADAGDVELDSAAADEPENDAAAETGTLWRQQQWDAPPAYESADDAPPRTYAAPTSPPPPGSDPDPQYGSLPLVPPGESEVPRKRRRTTMWVIVGLLLLLLCCCAFLLSAYYVWGDPLMRALGVY